MYIKGKKNRNLSSDQILPYEMKKNILLGAYILIIFLDKMGIILFRAYFLSQYFQITVLKWRLFFEFHPTKTSLLNVKTA